MHNLSPKVLNALTCSYTEVGGGGQLKCCNTLQIPADLCSFLREAAHDQLQISSNAVL